MELLHQPGESLRQARKTAGLDIADVVHRMKFPRSVVEALEKDDYTVFPSPTYAKSYLSQYAEFLGIDPSKWLDFFEPAAFTGPQDVLSMIESPDEHEPRSVAPGSRSSSAGNMVPTVLLILLTAGLIYAVITGYTYLESKFGGTVAGKEAPAAAPTEAPAPAPGATATPVANPTPSQGVTSATATPAPAAVESGPPPRATIVRED